MPGKERGEALALPWTVAVYFCSTFRRTNLEVHVESLFLSLEDLCRRHPMAVKAFRPLTGPYPFIFAATEDRVVLGNIENHLVLALAAWPPFPVDPTSLLMRAVSISTRHEVLGHVRPKIRAAGTVDQNGIVRSYECPSLDVHFNDRDRGPAIESFVNELRVALYDFCDTRRRRTA